MMGQLTQLELPFAGGSQFHSWNFRSRSKERKFQGAKVTHLELSLPGANGLVSEKSSYQPIHACC